MGMFDMPSNTFLRSVLVDVTPVLIEMSKCLFGSFYKRWKPCLFVDIPQYNDSLGLKVQVLVLCIIYILLPFSKTLPRNDKFKLFSSLRMPLMSNNCN